MTAVAVVLAIVLVGLWSEYSAKSRRLKQLEDAVDIANAATGFEFTFHQIATIYSYVAKGTVNFDAVKTTLNSVTNQGVYHQIFSDIDSANELRDYRNLGLMDYHKIQELLEKIDEGKIDLPKNLNAWYTLTQKKHKG